jgi:hypothetical protein
MAAAQLHLLCILLLLLLQLLAKESQKNQKEGKKEREDSHGHVTHEGGRKYIPDAAEEAKMDQWRLLFSLPAMLLLHGVCRFL